MAISINIHHYHHHRHDGLSELRREIEMRFGHLHQQMETIMSNLEDIQTTLGTIGTHVDKIGTETQSLLDKIAQLSTTDPTQQALIDSIAEQANGIAAKLQAVDDLVPDAAAPTGGDTGAGDTGEGSVG